MTENVWRTRSIARGEPIFDDVKFRDWTRALPNEPPADESQRNDIENSYEDTISS